jgi:hypothetical protein
MRALDFSVIPVRPKLSTVSDIRLLLRYACLVIGYRRFGTHTNFNDQAVQSA